MDNTNQENSNGSPPKKVKLFSGGEEDEEKVFTLGYDCFEQAFKWLGLKDLLNVRLTSKKFKGHADTYIEATYKKKFTLGYAKITIYDATNIYDVCRSAQDLTQQIKGITFTGIDLQPAYMIDEFIVILGQLEEVTFKNVTMTAEFRTLLFQFW